MKVTSDLVLFWGGVFSQWYPCKFTVNNIEYNCAEQYMMATKALLFKDEQKFKEILDSKNPRIQKQLGRKVSNFDPARWDDACLDIVTYGSLAKFGQNKDLRLELFKTHGKILAEASPYDKIWGIGLAEDDDRALDPDKWLGVNLLGNCLMKVRDILSLVFNNFGGTTNEG